MIRLSVPGTLSYRDLVLRVVASGCRLLSSAPSKTPYEQDSEFVNEVVSAVSEAFNNVAIHAYRDVPGDVGLEISADEHAITIQMSDTGRSFDPATVPDPDLSTLPERSLGLYIIRSFMDEVEYVAGGAPDRSNVLTLRKRFPRFRYPEGEAS